ncbi:MAG: NAD(P)H-binding protein [Acidimicrobiales bacterium]
MHVFVTGASGHIASAVIPELLGAGPEVVGLARSEAAVGAVEGLGAKVQRGSLDDLDALADAAVACDGVIHLAVRHDLVYRGDMEGRHGCRQLIGFAREKGTAAAFREIAEAIASKLDLPARSVTPEDAGDWTTWAS